MQVNVKLFKNVAELQGSNPVRIDIVIKKIAHLKFPAEAEADEFFLNKLFFVTAIVRSGFLSLDFTG